MALVNPDHTVTETENLYARLTIYLQALAREACRDIQLQVRAFPLVDERGQWEFSIKNKKHISSLLPIVELDRVGLEFGISKEWGLLLGGETRTALLKLKGAM